MGVEVHDHGTLGAFLETLSQEEMDIFRAAQQVWPLPDIDERAHDEHLLRGSLWIGPAMVASFPMSLDRLGISHVICMTESPPFLLQASASVDMLHLPVEDMPSANIYELLDRAVEYICTHVARGGRVLVHCQAGRSRSAAVSAAFLLRATRCSLQAAVEAVRVARSVVNINYGFLEQLQSYASRPSHEAARCLRDDCELCRLEKTTPWFQEANDFTVLLCDQCDQPMAVWKHHTMLLSTTEKQLMREALTKHASAHFGDDDWYLDDQQRSIYNHCHWHARRHNPLSRLLAQRRAERVKDSQSGSSQTSLSRL
eukprot:TRINITY_DN10589_c0_g1_i1.p1 TRINITY_DN10589_c0_g1~~TRINITY_DN10589_c0_g1_i1.p1  ORF type:complete len:313 (+),score=36.50 TRINITY_DN10589_c0_g1_i1:262-1200(+)